MVELLFERGFRQVCINSNGIKLARPAFVERLARCRGGQADNQLFVYLQFDGFEEETHAALRGRGALANQPMPDFDPGTVRHWLKRFNEEVDKGKIRYLRFHLRLS